ncbi:hypothetical protein C0J52_14464 [Blattella germanica]|nr:hypothetical protein C0J52_14464 [Blattella germanica]
MSASAAEFRPNTRRQSKSPEGRNQDVNKVTKNWYEAKDLCDKDGAHLLVLESRDQANDVNYWVEVLGTISNWFWIGFNDLNQEAQYVTVFNQSVSDVYLKWWSGYPTGRADYDCGAAYFTSGEQHGMADLYCFSAYYYICQIKV